MRRSMLLAGLLIALFAAGWWVGRGSAGPGGDLYRNLDVFVEVLQRVQSSYVDVVPSEGTLMKKIQGQER